MERTPLLDDTELDEFLLIENPVTIKVGNLPQLPNLEQDLIDFFSFCGTINSLTVLGNEATIIFQTPEAARSASLLNGASLHQNSNKLTVQPVTTAALVKSPAALVAEAAAPAKTNESIIQSLLAEGYLLADTAGQQAKLLDEQYQLSQKANSVLQPISDKVHALDQQYQVSETCQAAIEDLGTKIQAVDQEYHIGATLNQAVQAVVTTGELARDVIVARSQETSVAIHESTEEIRNQGETATMSAIASAATALEGLNLQEKGEAVAATIHNFVEQQPAWGMIQNWALGVHNTVQQYVSGVPDTPAPPPVESQ